MIKGFSILEMVVALTISLCILTFVVANVGESMRISRRVISNQQKMESIFHTVDMIRSDLTKCGMRLQDAARYFSFPLFENSDFSFKVIYGIEDENLLADSLVGANYIMVNRNEYFQVKRKIIIYDPDKEIYETNEIKGFNSTRLILLNTLQNNYPKNSVAVVLKEVEYKLYSEQNSLKRKVNKGYFQPVIEEVTDFNVKFYPEARSVLYRIEVNKKEQVRGYIFLTNMEQ
jgi:hypothetical protein